jgi:hypothetical protein
LLNSLNDVNGTTQRFAGSDQYGIDIPLPDLLAEVAKCRAGATFTTLAASTCKIDSNTGLMRFDSAGERAWRRKWCGGCDALPWRADIDKCASAR